MEASTKANKRKDWSSLQLEKPLNPLILHSLHQNNFQTMLPVQQAAIPLMLKNYDLAVQAQTGSGKTLAFLIPLLQKLLQNSIENLSSRQEKGILAIKFVILSPTRQLCQQTNLVLKKLLTSISRVGQKYLQYCQCTTGGRPFQLDLDAIKEKQPFILISTIGRLRQLCQHMEQNWLKKIDYLYIDEADRVLKQKGVQQVMNKIQKMRRTAMFSATLAGIKPQHYKFFGMRNLAKISLKNVVEPNKNELKTQDETIDKEKKLANYIIPKTLKNTYIMFQNRLQKVYYLINLLNQLFTHKANLKVIVFFNTCASVDYYNKLLAAIFEKLHSSEQLFSSLFIGLHGKLKPKKRNSLLTKFTTDNSRPYCLLATDVVARGIDFDSIQYIIQVDPPQDPDNYVHRIGRTARVDKQGTAVLLLEQHENCFIKFLNNEGVAISQYEADSFIKQELGMNKKKNKKQIQYLTQDEIQQNVMEIVLNDRDYNEKAKKAFVSYLRSYKQHDLKYIFQFKNMGIGSTADSFFLLRIPRVKQILGKKIQNFTQSEINPETIPWQDKNQQLQYLKKRKKLQQAKAQKEKLQRKFQLKQDIKNKKSKRKRQKNKKQRKDLKMINKQHNLLRREKKGNMQIQQMESQSDEDSNEDTEEIEKRIFQKIGK